MLQDIVRKPFLQRTHARGIAAEDAFSEGIDLKIRKRHTKTLAERPGDGQWQSRIMT
jgi:hypothetical protein